MSTKSQLTSVRLSTDTLQLIEKFVDKHDYWSRNMVINCVLTTVFQRFNQNDIYDMVRTWEGTKNPITAIYRINDLLHENGK